MNDSSMYVRRILRMRLQISKSRNMRASTTKFSTWISKWIFLGIVVHLAAKRNLFWIFFTFLLMSDIIPIRVSTCCRDNPSRGTPSANESAFSGIGSHKWRMNIATYALNTFSGLARKSLTNLVESQTNFNMVKSTIEVYQVISRYIKYNSRKSIFGKKKHAGTLAIGKDILCWTLDH